MTWGDRVHGRVGVKKLWMAQKVVKEKKLALTKGGVDIEDSTRGPRRPIKFLHKVLMHLLIRIPYIMALHQPKKTHQHPNFIFCEHFSITEGPIGLVSFLFLVKFSWLILYNTL